MLVTPQLIAWTHEALEGLYDVAFLESHVREAVVKGRFAGGCALQEALQQVIKQLRPPLTVPERSPASRIYNVLNLRYVQGLTQNEAASELNLSVRHFKREQERAISAAATMLFEQSAVMAASLPTTAEPALAQTPTEFVRIDDLLRLSLNILEPLLQRQNLQVQVVQPAQLPLVRASRVVARQMIISALSWLVHGVADCMLSIAVTGEAPQVVLRLNRPTPSADTAASEELETVRQMAGVLAAQVRLLDVGQAVSLPYMLELALPISETRCVLMVEDNADAIELVQRYLEQSGEYHLVALTRADEALRQAALLQPVCILLDIMMPERDGWDVLTLLKADPQTATIPVVVSSVVKGHDLAYALGAVDVLPKPFSAAQLIAVLRSAEARAYPLPARPAHERSTQAEQSA
ncbi:MAG: response regulator [Chloroflexi bacterium]|nr:response regulator [Chloroflexota bacterium]